MNYQQTAAIFKALSHPARLHILDILRDGERCVCHIEAALNKRQSYVSQQLMILREQSLVASRKDGMRVYYTLSSPVVSDILDLVLGDNNDEVWIDGCPCPHCETVEEISC